VVRSGDQRDHGDQCLSERRREQRARHSRSQRAGPACRTAPTGPPARPWAAVSCGLRGGAWETSRGRIGKRVLGHTGPRLVSSYSRRRGRPSTAAASSHRELSRPNSSSRLKALHRVPWPVRARDPPRSRMVWARPNPWNVACPERSNDSATSGSRFREPAGFQACGAEEEDIFLVSSASGRRATGVVADRAAGYVAHVHVVDLRPSPRRITLCRC
jgi:hypothetical protein